MISVNFRKNDPAFPRLLAKKLNDLQSNIAGKSDTGHTHEIVDVTGLQTALDGKVSTTTTIAGVNLQDSITKAELLAALNVEDGADDNVIESITVNGNAATINASTKTASVTIPEASQSTSGVMSSTDKIKLDNLETIKGIKSDEKIVSLTQNTDLLQTTLSIAIEQGTVGTADEGKTFIRLKGIGGAEVSSVDASSFVIDGMLQSAEIYSYDGTTWTPSTPTGGIVPSTAGVYIRLAWNSDAGDQVSYLDVSTLIDAYTAGNGLELSANNEFSIKIDSTPGNVTLTTSTNGLKANVDLSGKQDALTAGTNISINNNTVSAKGYVYDDTKYSFAEGISGNNTASGNSSHAEGDTTIANGGASHAEGVSTTAFGDYSHAEGEGTIAYGVTSHVEGTYDFVDVGGIWEYDDNSTVIREHEGSGGIPEISVNQIVKIKDGDEYVYRKVVSVGETSFTVDKAIVHGETETYISTVLGGIAYGRDSHAEGKSCAIGDYSHAEGYSTASGNISHTEGISTTASGLCSHAEGDSTTASNDHSHAEGISTTASGYSSHAEGNDSVASGYASHAGGNGTIANQDNMTAIGKYNKTYDANSATTLFVVGDGSEDSRHNAFEVINEVSANTTYSTRATVNSFDNVLLGMPIGSVVLWSGDIDGSHGSVSGGTPEGWLTCTGGTIDVLAVNGIDNEYDFTFTHMGSTGYYKASNTIYSPLCKVIGTKYGYSLENILYGTINLPNIPTTSNMNYIIKYK